MDTNLISRFAPVIRNLTAAELRGSPSLRQKLTLAQDGDLQVCYAPFEYINPSARVVLVGITPGNQQMVNAVAEARSQLDAGRDLDHVVMAAKQVGAFSGDIRGHLVNLLDHIGLHCWLGIDSCMALFSSARNLVQTTSVLRNPVFYRGKDYNGTPNMTRHPLLRSQLAEHFLHDVRALPNAVFVPLGDKVSAALEYLAEQGHLNGSRILAGLPHPSPQNIERVRYFLGQKAREALSTKTSPDKIDAAREGLRARVSALA